MEREEANFEPVHANLQHWDRPREGVASMEGRPYFFQCEWDEEADGYAEAYRLWPIDEAVLVLVQESWGIWLRWAEAFHGGRTDGATCPALPEDRARNTELNGKVDEALAAAQAGVFLRREARFRKVDRQNYLVMWSLCDG